MQNDKWRSGFGRWWSQTIWLYSDRKINLLSKMIHKSMQQPQTSHPYQLTQKASNICMHLRLDICSTSHMADAEKVIWPIPYCSSCDSLPPQLERSRLRQDEHIPTSMTPAWLIHTQGRRAFRWQQPRGSETVPRCVPRVLIRYNPPPTREEAAK
jgi:hypothetical protein